MPQEKRDYIDYPTCYISWVHKASLVNEDTQKQKPLTARESQILSYLIKHQGKSISLEELARHVWGENYDVGDKPKDPLSLKRHIASLRTKLDELRNGLSTCLCTDFGFGSYTLNIESLPPENPSEKDPETKEPSDANPPAAPDDWPKALTPSFGNITEEDVLHRRNQVKELEERLSRRKETLLIFGFGGIGKTSVARVLYQKLANEYDHIGWIVYSQDLKTSILTSFEVNADISNQEYRWRVISDYLKAGKKKILLFVDNVDRDLSKGQDPTSDQLLLEISGWPNISLVLTSRMEELLGYHPFEIGFLADGACEDLFYYYYDRRGEFSKPREARAKRDAVQRLIGRASYHTLAIELLAKSAKAKRSLSLGAFADEIERSGFQFPSREIMTSHGGQQSVVNQLRGLFDLNTRTDIEQKLLWDISVLPSTILSYEEIWEYLGYGEEDMDALLMEGWLTPRDGGDSNSNGIYMHPLVRETIHLDLDEEKKAPPGTVAKLVDALSRLCFFDEEDSFHVWIRKFELTSNALRFVNLADDFIPIVQHMGRTAQKLGRIDAAVDYFQDVLSACEDANSPDEALATAYNDLGYQLSYISGGHSLANSYLSRAYEIRKALFEKNPRQYAESFATTCDYLGYLSSPQGEGEELLHQALAIREELARQDPDRYLHDEAWTRDNLGYLLTGKGQYDDAEDHLCKALCVRKSLEAQHPGKYLTEVAWTCGNLAFLLQSKGSSAKEAEDLYIEANRALELADEKMPGVHTVDMAHNDNNLAVLLSADASRQVESVTLLEQAHARLLLLQSKSTLYTNEINIIIGNLAAIVSLRGNSEEMSRFCQIIECTYKKMLLSPLLMDFNEWCILHNFGLFCREIGDHRNAAGLFSLIFQRIAQYNEMIRSMSKPLPLDFCPMHIEVKRTALRLNEVLHFDSPDYADDTISDDALARMDEILSESSCIMFAFSGARTMYILRPIKRNRMVKVKGQ